MTIHHTEPDVGMAKQGQQGLSLIELWLFIAILALLLGWGLPGFQQLAARNAVSTEVTRLKNALHLARQTAITRRQVVTVCPSERGRQCRGSDWSRSLLVVLGEAQGTIAADAIVARLNGGKSVTVRYRRDGRPLRFKPLGRATGHNGTFRICGKRNQGAAVVISNFGRVRIDGTTPSSCRQPDGLTATAGDRQPRE